MAADLRVHKEISPHPTHGQPSFTNLPPIQNDKLINKHIHWGIPRRVVGSEGACGSENQSPSACETSPPSPSLKIHITALPVTRFRELPSPNSIITVLRKFEAARRTVWVCRGYSEGRDHYSCPRLPSRR